MATAEEYAQWIVDNQDQQGTPEFDTVARAYEMAKQQSQTEKTPNPVATAVQTALPLAAGNMTQATGMANMAGELSGAVSPYAKSALAASISGYKAHPLLTPLIDAVGIGTMGTPIASAYNGIMGAGDQFKRAQGAVNGVGQVLSNTPGNPVNYFNMGKAIPEVAPILEDLYHNKGGPNAIKAWLQSPEAAQYMKNPAFAQAAEQYTGMVPGRFAQIGKVLGPIARGLGRVAGPVGIGLNIHDAAPYLNKANIGQNAAEGNFAHLKNPGQILQQQHNTQYGAPISPEQAQAVLESGSPRDIEGLGGQEFLNTVIRQQAAAQALKFKGLPSSAQALKPVRPQQLP